MKKATSQFYEFGSFRLDPVKRLLLRDGEVVAITPKAFDTLLTLVENNDQLLEKDQLMKMLWPDTIVEEHNLTVNISALRKALGESPNKHEYIVTIPGHGYRFVANVNEVMNGSACQIPNSDVAVKDEQREASKESANEAKKRTLSVRAASFVHLALSRKAIVAGVLTIILAGAAYYFFNRTPVPILTERDTILLADFTNLTDDPVFDETLKRALAVQLEQSPFLSIFPDQRVRETLRYMNRSPDERVIKDVALEICQRQGIKAMLTGSIASLGSHYIITLEAFDAQAGTVIAREQAEAESKERVLRTLGNAATKLREKLGESLSSIQKFDTPLEQGTTSSLEAFQAFSLGVQKQYTGKYLEAIPFLKRAIELDPDFASANYILSMAYFNGEGQRLAAECAEKAFQLRERVSEREKLSIAYAYYYLAIQDLNKAIEVLGLWEQIYPRDWRPSNNLALLYDVIGQFEKAIEAARESIRRDPSRPQPYSNMAWALMSLNRFDEAREICERAIAQNIESSGMRLHRLYKIAFVQGDQAAMQQQIDWATGKPSEHEALDVQVWTAAFSGQLHKAHNLSRRMVEMAERRNLKEVAAMSAAVDLKLDALFGNGQQARARIPQVLALARESNSLERVIFAVALCGEAAQVQSLADELAKKYPQATAINAILLPMVRAMIELNRGNPEKAIQLLEVARPYEQAALFGLSYLRGHAYLRKGAVREAAVEFQKIVDYRGLDPTSPLYPLAYVGLARAAAMAGDTDKSRKAYEDFFTLWKDADPDIPILQQARQEYAKLK